MDQIGNVSEVFVDKVEELRKYIARQGISKEGLAHILAVTLCTGTPDFEGVTNDDLHVAQQFVTQMMAPGGKARYIDVMKKMAAELNLLDDDWKELEE